MPLPGRTWQERRCQRCPADPRSSGECRSISDRTTAVWGLIVVGAEGSEDATGLSVEGTATHLVFAHVCDSRARTTVAGQSSDYVNPAVTAPGEHLADYVIVYADGSEARVPVRRRFEVNQVNVRSQSGFVSRQHQDLTALEMRGPYPEKHVGPFSDRSHGWTHRAHTKPAAIRHAHDDAFCRVMVGLRHAEPTP